MAFDGPDRLVPRCAACECLVIRTLWGQVGVICRDSDQGQGQSKEEIIEKPERRR